MNRAGIVRVLLRIYKLGPGAVFLALGVRCRHEPSCSVYGAACVTDHGWWPGAWMTLARLVRCRPGGSYGYDPAPETCPDVPLWAPWRYGDWRGGKGVNARPVDPPQGA
ncbi:MAG: hypothetical protein RL291_1556 [Pseudomonadota bacterium]|jgi:putative membrane protein insertion efficiency factor